MYKTVITQESEYNKKNCCFVQSWLFSTFFYYHTGI